MNSFIPLLLIIMLAGGENNDNFSTEKLLPVLKMAGVDTSILDTLNTSPLAELIGGKDFSPEKILPIALSMLNNTDKSPLYHTKTQNKKDTEDENFSSMPNYLKPISSIADEEINFALENYFTGN